MEYTEQELEEFICETNNAKINDIKISLLDRQVAIGYYRMDLLGEDDEGNLYVFELKKGKIDGNALSQVLCYMWFVTSYLSKSEKHKHKKVFGILVGNDITDYTHRGLKLIKNVFYVQSIPSFDILWEDSKGLTEMGNKETLFGIHFFSL